MGFTSFKMRAGDTGTVSTGFVRSYTLNYVITTDALATVWEVGSHPNLPRVMIDKHPNDALAWCTSLSPTQRQDNPFVWDVTAQFSYALDGFSGGGPFGGLSGNPLIDGQGAGKPPAERVEDPLTRPNDYSYRTQVVRNEAIWHDTIMTEEDKTAPIVPPATTHPRVPLLWRNTAGDIISEPFLRPVYGLSITVGINLPGAPDTSWDKLCGKLNSNQCTVGTRIFSRRTLMMMGYSAHPVYERGVSYWRWEVDVLYKPDFYHVIISKGLNANFMVSGKVEKLPISSGSKGKLSGVQVLDADGYCVSEDATRFPKKLIFDCYEDGTFPTHM